MGANVFDVRVFGSNSVSDTCTRGEYLSRTNKGDRDSSYYRCLDDRYLARKCFGIDRVIRSDWKKTPVEIFNGFFEELDVILDEKTGSSDPRALVLAMGNLNKLLSYFMRKKWDVSPSYKRQIAMKPFKGITERANEYFTKLRNKLIDAYSILIPQGIRLILEDTIVKGRFDTGLISSSDEIALMMAERNERIAKHGMKEETEKEFMKRFYKGNASSRRRLLEAGLYLFHLLDLNRQYNSDLSREITYYPTKEFETVVSNNCGVTPKTVFNLLEDAGLIEQVSDFSVPSFKYRDKVTYARRGGKCARYAFTKKAREFMVSYSYSTGERVVAKNDKSGEVVMESFKCKRICEAMRKKLDQLDTPVERDAISALNLSPSLELTALALAFSTGRLHLPKYPVSLSGKWWRPRNVVKALERLERGKAKAAVQSEKLYRGQKELPDRWFLLQGGDTGGIKIEGSVFEDLGFASDEKVAELFSFEGAPIFSEKLRQLILDVETCVYADDPSSTISTKFSTFQRKVGFAFDRDLATPDNELVISVLKRLELEYLTWHLAVQMYSTGNRMNTQQANIILAMDRVDVPYLLSAVVDDYSGRFHNVLTRMNSEFREHLTTRSGDLLYEHDIKSSQPMMLSLLLEKKFGEGQKLFDLTVEGKYYETLAAEAGMCDTPEACTKEIRKKAKHLNMLAMFSSKNGTPEAKLFDKMIRSVCGDKSADWILSLRTKDRGKSALPRYLQTLERKIILDGIGWDITNLGVLFNTIHDSVVVTENLKFMLEELFDEHVYLILRGRVQDGADTERKVQRPIDVGEVLEELEGQELRQAAGWRLATVK